MAATGTRSAAHGPGARGRAIAAAAAAPLLQTEPDAGANPAAAVDVLHKIDAAGYDAYLTWGRFCVPPLNATGELADEAFARECQLALVKGGLAHPCRK